MTHRLALQWLAWRRARGSFVGIGIMWVDHHTFSLPFTLLWTYLEKRSYLMAGDIRPNLRGAMRRPVVASVALRWPQSLPPPQVDARWMAKRARSPT